MNNAFQKSLSGFTIYTLFIALFSSAAYIWVPQIPITAAFPYLIILIYLLTAVILFWLMKSLRKKPNRFINNYMLVNFAKLFFYVILIFIYGWLNREDAIAFIITFFIYYVLFTAYEVVTLLRISRKEPS
jgi:hypothetical protein